MPAYFISLVSSHPLTNCCAAPGHKAHEERWNNFHIYRTAVIGGGQLWPGSDVYDVPAAVGSDTGMPAIPTGVLPHLQQAQHEVHGRDADSICTGRHRG